MKVGLECLLPFFWVKEGTLAGLPRNYNFFMLEGTLEYLDLVLRKWGPEKSNDIKVGSGKWVNSKWVFI